MFWYRGTTRYIVLYGAIAHQLTYIYTIEYTLGVWGRESLKVRKIGKCLTIGRIFSRLSKVNASIFLHSLLENLEDNEKVAIFAAEKWMRIWKMW